jgi:sulfoacetaldehyde dehydrogenase
MNSSFEESIYADSAAIIAQRARIAQRKVAHYTQAQIDDVVYAVAWAVFRPGRSEELAALAVRDTGMGCVDDKIEKNRQKVIGVLHDLSDAPSVGVFEERRTTGVTILAKPVGVVAAILPSAHPAAAAVVKAMLVLKGRNSIIFAPSPKGAATCELAVSYMRSELARIGAPANLVQCLPRPVTREQTRALAAQCDRIVATASQSNVRAAYLSGTPTIGTGPGNVPVIVDATADIHDAARKIVRSKTFDFGLSCSSENAIIIEDLVYEQMVQSLQREGAYVLSDFEKHRLERALWRDGRLNRNLIGKAPLCIAEAAGLTDAARTARCFIVEEDRIGRERPFSGEKMSVILTAYRAASFNDAVRRLQRILEVSGMGHSCGIHTRHLKRAEHLASVANVSNVLVNQAHALNNSGSFENGLSFTLSLGCGSWAKNSTTGNLTYSNFLNFTTLARPVSRAKRDAHELFKAYHEKYGE